MYLTPWLYPLLFATGTVAGLVDAIAGGGGIIALPVLLSCGLPVPLALGTSKLQSSFGSVSASIHYTRHGLIDFKACRLGVVFTLIGAITGVWAVQSIHTDVVEHLIPWLLAAVLIYTIFRPQVGQSTHPARWPAPVFFGVFGLVLGFYDGFLGPGVGSFWTIALITIMGFDFAKATGMTKVLNAASNLVSLLIFALGGKIIVSVGLTMGAGQFLGARIGSGLVMKKGARFVRPIFLTMVTLTLARLLYLRLTHTP